MPILSIIIVSHNTSSLLEKCLYSIKKQTPIDIFEIVVVDNNSTDNSVEMIKTKFANVKLIQNKENGGYGKANNQGAKVANGDFLLFLNSDTEILDNSLSKMVEFARKNPNSVIGPKLLNPDLSPQKSCGRFFSLPVVFTMLFLKGESLGITRFSPDNTTNVDWVSGACLLIKKTIFESVGRFDEKIFMYMDEVDLQERLKQRGNYSIFYPETSIMHIVGASSRGKEEPVLNIYKGLQYLYNKHYSKQELRVLRLLLKIKAFGVQGIGICLGKKELVNTYRKAYEAISKN